MRKKTHPTIPEPAYVSYLENQRVLIDVGTLLRGILFLSSHSRRLLDAIGAAEGAVALISNHIRDAALRALNKEKPDVISQFCSELLYRIKNNSIVVVPDGSTSLLPAGASYDPIEDDIVMATALASESTKLATLDFELANTAGQFIEIITPWDRERSDLIAQIAQPEADGSISFGFDSLNIHLSPTQGSILMNIQPESGSTNYVRRGGRRYVFCTDAGFACWLGGKTWKYQVGHCDVSDPFFTFQSLEREAPILLGISYDCVEKYMCFGIGEAHTGDKTFYLKEKHHCTYERIINEQISFLSRANGNDHFFGYWHGIATTAKHVEMKGLQYALENRRHFLPHDIQRYELNDAVLEHHVTVAPSEIHGG